MDFGQPRAEVPSRLEAREVGDDPPSIAILGKLLALFSTRADNSAKLGIPGNENRAGAVMTP